MNFYTMVIILALIVVICYLANLYVQSGGFRRDKNLLFKIYNVLVDIRCRLEEVKNLQKKQYEK